MKFGGFILAIFLVAVVHAAPLTLVENGKSAYVIYHDAKAVDSVKDAAKELQTYLAKATGAKLVIVTALPKTPMIALGAGDHLAAASLNLDGVRPEGFRVATAGQNLYIFGTDDAGRNAKGGIGRGTANGVYTFLETYLGIRWLMPGDVGEVVPSMPTLKLAETNLTDGPDFANRRIMYIREKDPLVQRWILRNKLGYSVELMHGHNWDCFTPGVYDNKPEIFTQIGGKRVRPAGGAGWICTTSAEAIRFMALRQIGYFYQNPGAAMGSLSPRDGGGEWCECDACKALDETGPDGQIIRTKRLAVFYNQVSEAVAKKLPNALLGGYLYLDYIDPPADKSFRFHPNFYPVFAPLFYYGPMAYRPEAQERFHRLLEGWTPVGDGRMSFYGLPRLLQGAGRFSIPVPPGRKVLKDIYPALKKANFMGARVDGMDAWGYGGSYNWVTAKLLWHADSDVDVLCDEYYNQAYGKGGPAMAQLDKLLEDGTERYITEDKTATYHMQPKAIRAIYLPVYAQLEALYKQADAAAADSEGAKKRLALFGESMRGLYRVLEDYGWLMNARDSIFYMSEPDFIQWVDTQKASIYINPGGLAANAETAARLANILKTPITATPQHDVLPNAEPVRPYLIRFKNHLLLHSEREGEVKLKFTVRTNAKGGEMAYKIYDSTGNLVTSGQAAEIKDVVFLARQGGNYHVLLESTLLGVSVEGASWAIDTQYSGWPPVKEPHLLMVQETTPMYFYVPKGTPKFSMILASQAPAETGAATLYDPANKPVATFETAQRGDDSKVIPCEGLDGWWKLDIGKAKTGTLDDVWVLFGPEISYASLDPANRLIVEKVK